eukprot:3306300-Amphidinium_carterae.2
MMTWACAVVKIVPLRLVKGSNNAYHERKTLLIETLSPQATYWSFPCKTLREGEASVSPKLVTEAVSVNRGQD